MPLFCKNCSVRVEPLFDSETGEISCPECGNDLSYTKNLKAGTVINGFMIEHEIGRGGMGVVYLATQVNLKRKVALKILPESLAMDDAFVEGFFREARAAGSLSHPNIVQVFDAGVTPDGIYYFVMELIDGNNIDSLIMKNGALDIDLGLSVAEKISAAMAYAWDKQNLCHRDIKPENIIIKANGDIKLADLGLAKSYAEEAVDEGDIMATPLYAAPELIRFEREKIGFRTDMYSFGATLFHIFAGIPPFPGTDPQKVCDMQLNAYAPPLGNMNPNIPIQISILVERLLEKEIEYRPDSWQEVNEVIFSVIRQRDRKKRGFEEALLNAKIAERRRFTLIVFNILLLLVLLCGAFFSYIYYFLDENPLKNIIITIQNPNETQPMENLPVETRTLTEKRWDSLNRSLGGMALDDAIAKLETFIAENKSEGYPPEADKVLELLMKRRAGEEELKSFRNEVNSTLDDLKGITLRTEENLEKLRQVWQKIDSVLSKYAKNETSSLFPALTMENKILLETARIEVMEKILYLDQVNSEKQALQREKELEEQKQLLKRQNLAADNLIRLLKNNMGQSHFDSVVYLLPRLEEWERSYPDASGGEKNIVKNLKRFSTSLQLPLWEIMDINKDVFKRTQFMSEFPGYGFDSADSKAMKFAFTEGSVTLGKRVPWSSLTPGKLQNILLNILENPSIFPELGRQYQEALVNQYFVRSGDISFVRLFCERNLLTGEDIPLLKLLPFFESLPDEFAALDLWDGLLGSLNSGEIATARVYAENLSGNYSGTGIFLRNKAAISGVLLEK